MDSAGVTSPDGRQRWNGSEWVPNESVAVPSAGRLSKNWVAAAACGVLGAFFFVMGAIGIPVFAPFALLSLILGVLFLVRALTYKTCGACRANVPKRASVCPTCHRAVA